MATAKKSLRVYFVTLEDGRLTGTLMRSWQSFLDGPPPSGWGATEAEVLDQVALGLQAELARHDGALDRYLWDERFHVRAVRVDVHPMTAIDKQPVVGKRQVPLRLSYAWSRTRGGAYRVMLPRFGWWMILEDLDTAPAALRQAVAGDLLGASARWIYEFRDQGEEYVREWTPESMMQRLGAATGLDDDGLDAFPTLLAVSDELVTRASRRRLPTVVGDDLMLAAEEGTFFASPRPSVLLVGEPGVGKTTFVHRLARRFLAWRRRKMDAPRLWSTSGDRILAGMIYLGMWQERCLQIVEELAHEGDYLYVDHLTGILRPQADGSSIADLLAPAVLAGEIALLAECTEAELVQARRRYADLVDAFTILRLEEPSTAAALPLLSTYNDRRKGPPIHPEAMKRLLRHLATFRRDARLPGKGFRFLDWLHHGSRKREAMMFPADVSEAFAEHTGLPVELIGDEHPATVADIEARLAAGVIGQDAACTACARVLVPFKAGMQDPDRPVGSLLFVGPTGVGKTELAKQLTRTLFGSEDRMIRLDMSEYMVPGAAQRLLAVGRGVTSLAERVRRQPLSVVLLDEIEKAHPEVFDLLLGVLGEGRLTDSLGRLVDLRMCVLVMTSNLGVSERAPVGFEGGEPGGFLRSVREHFRPELFNRIDRVVSFRSLSPEDVERIVELELEKSRRRRGLRRRRIQLLVEPAARKRLAELGYHRTRGARPLKRVVEERVITPVAVRMAADPSLRDRTLEVVLRDGEIVLL